MKYRYIDSAIKIISSKIFKILINTHQHSQFEASSHNNCDIFFREIIVIFNKFIQIKNMIYIPLKKKWYIMKVIKLLIYPFLRVTNYPYETLIHYHQYEIGNNNFTWFLFDNKLRQEVLQIFFLTKYYNFFL